MQTLRIVGKTSNVKFITWKFLTANRSVSVCRCVKYRKYALSRIISTIVSSRKVEREKEKKKERRRDRIANLKSSSSDSKFSRRENDSRVNLSPIET